MVGDVFRRLVAKTVAQQFGLAIERATIPFQHVLSTRAGTECIAHAIQALTDLDPAQSWGVRCGVIVRAMLQGLQTVVGGNAALPFVMPLNGSASTYLWEDQDGVEPPSLQAGSVVRKVTHSCRPRPCTAPCSAIPALDDERLFAFLDDAYFVCSPDRVSAICWILQNVLFHHSSDPCPPREDQVWNKGRRGATCASR